MTMDTLNAAIEHEIFIRLTQHARNWWNGCVRENIDAILDVYQGYGLDAAVAEVEALADPQVHQTIEEKTA